MINFLLVEQVWLLMRKPHGLAVSVALPPHLLHISTFPKPQKQGWMVYNDVAGEKIGWVDMDELVWLQIIKEIMSCYRCRPATSPSPPWAHAFLCCP